MAKITITTNDNEVIEILVDIVESDFEGWARVDTLGMIQDAVIRAQNKDSNTE